jgi:hypothetical protein
MRHLTLCFVALLGLASFLMGSVHFYYWWVEGRLHHAEVVYRYAAGGDGDVPLEGV